MSERIITLEPGQRLTILAAPRPAPLPKPPEIPPPPRPPFPPTFPTPPTPPPRARPPPTPIMPPPEILVRLPRPPPFPPTFPVPPTPPPRGPPIFFVQPAQTQLLGALGLLDMIMARIAALRSRFRGQVDEQYGYQVDFQPLPEELGVESR